jgi:bacterioferritin
MGQAASVQKPFLTDVKTLRERARKNLNDGAIGSNLCRRREQDHRDFAVGAGHRDWSACCAIPCIPSRPRHLQRKRQEEFAVHAKEEHEHACMVAERINQLGGKPNFNPDGLHTARPHNMSKAKIWWT